MGEGANKFVAMQGLELCVGCMAGWGCVCGGSRATVPKRTHASLHKGETFVHARAGVCVGWITCYGVVVKA